MTGSRGAARAGRRPGGWLVHGVSVAGYRHRRDNVECQDAHDHRSTSGRDPVTVLAVADGAGSRARSGPGARLAVRLAIEHFGADIPRLREMRQGRDIRTALLERFDDVRTEFLDRTGPAADDFATTLTVVVLTHEWIGHLSVGDGLVILRAGLPDTTRQFHLLPRCESGSEYGNETIFLTSAEAPHRVRADCVIDRGVDGVLVSTDGLAQVALSSPEGPRERAVPLPNESFATTVLSTLEAPGADPEQDGVELATWLQSDRLTMVNPDDKTLLRAVRR